MLFQERWDCLVCCGAGVDSRYQFVEDDDAASLEAMRVSDRGEVSLFL